MRMVTAERDDADSSEALRCPLRASVDAVKVMVIVMAMMMKAHELTAMHQRSSSHCAEGMTMLVPEAMRTKATELQCC